MNDYKITYKITNFTTEHIKYISAENEQTARALFLETNDNTIVDANNVDILSVTRVIDPDEMCYCNCNSC